MNQEQNRLVTVVVRYGLPLVILVFYVTAVRQFEFTPDSTYAGATIAERLGTGAEFDNPSGVPDRMIPSPLWTVLQAIGIRASIDAVLCAKVFGLFFCCAALVFAYLAAYEVLEDRLLALGATIVIAAQAWLLFLAPTGNALALALAMTMVWMFLLLRNEYAVASLVAGLATLVLWEGVALFGLIIMDLALNSVVRTRAVRRAGLCALLYGAIVTPWLMYSHRTGIPAIPALLPLGTVPPADLIFIGAMLILVVLALLGLALSLARGGGWMQIRMHGAPVLGVALLLITGLVGFRERILLASPFLVIGAFGGVRRVVRAFGREELLTAAAVGLAVLMLTANQVVMVRSCLPVMDAVRESADECDAIGAWIKANASDSTSVAAEHPGEIGYRMGRPAFPLAEQGGTTAEIIVTSEAAVPGYTLAYLPPRLGGALPERRSLAVWRRQ